MTIKGAGGLVDELVDYLSANLGTHVTRVNTDLGEPLIQDVVEWRTSDPRGGRRVWQRPFANVQRTPTAWVAVMEWAIPQWGTDYLYGKAEVDIVVVTRSQTRELDQELGFRFAMALQRCLSAKELSKDGIWRLVGTPRAYFIENYMNTDPAMVDMRLSVTFEAEEND